MNVSRKIEIFILLALPFSAFAVSFVSFDSLVIEADTIPKGFVWCVPNEPIPEGGCYDGISYADLIARGVSKDLYPVTKLDYLMLTNETI